MIFRVLVDQVGEKLKAQKDADRRFMQLALALGRRGQGRTWPNPAVGAVVVTDLVARLDRDLGPMDADQRTDLNDGLRGLSSALGWRLDADGRTIGD